MTTPVPAVIWQAIPCEEKVMAKNHARRGRGSMWRKRARLSLKAAKVRGFCLAAELLCREGREKPMGTSTRLILLLRYWTAELVRRIGKREVFSIIMPVQLRKAQRGAFEITQPRSLIRADFARAPRYCIAHLDAVCGNFAGRAGGDAHESGAANQGVADGRGGAGRRRPELPRHRAGPLE